MIKTVACGCGDEMKKYIRNTEGNMAMVLGVGLLMVVMAVGVAVDYTGMTKRKTDYQNVADAAALAAARTGEVDETKLLRIAQKYVDQNYKGSENLTLKAHKTVEGRLQIRIKGEYKTAFMGLFGKPVTKVGAMTEVPLAASEPVNIALVLDVTGSMRGHKLAALKSAANSLVTTLEAKSATNLKMSVVPFAEYVNIGKSRRNAPWLEVSPDSTTPSGPQVCSIKKPVIGYDNKNCRTIHHPAVPAKPAHTCRNDGAAYPCGGHGPRAAYDETVCAPIYGPAQKVCETPTQSVKWHGCVGSRLSPWNKRAEYTNGHKIPGLMNIHCNARLLPLTQDLAKVKASVNTLSARGNTYLPAGLIWGWRTLTRSAPLTEANAQYAKNTRNIMILMTDGENTISQTGKTHEGKNTIAANTLSAELCQNIKDDNVEIFSIAYAFNDPAAKKVLQNCASDPSMYFDASNSTQLKAAFDEIARALLHLRIIL